MPVPQLARLARTSLLACALLVLAAGCRDSLVRPPTPDQGSGPSARDLGLVEITLSGIGTPEFHASAMGVTPGTLESGAAADLIPLPTGANGGLQMVPVASGSFVEGTREQGGQRYMWATFRVRNASENGTAYPDQRRNLTFIPVSLQNTVPGTPVARLNRFDGSRADSLLARSLVPTGAVTLDEAMQMKVVYPDVLQVYEEAEVQAFTAPPAVINRFPYGFVVRNPLRNGDRDLAGYPAAEQFDGLVTFSFRIPLMQSDPGQNNGSQKDAFTVSVIFLAVDDMVTRVTESLEEHGAEARAAVRTRATALSATMVTVLDGSPAMSPLQTPYPGQRQICGTRTAGTAAAPQTRITEPGAFSRLTMLMPGESLAGCVPYFLGGTRGRPATGVPFQVRVLATDRYGNAKPVVSDTIRLTSSLGGSLPIAAAALTGGEATLSITYGLYGQDTLTALSSRVRSSTTIPVAGVSRVWTGAESTEWTNGGNWDLGAPPLALDSVTIPVVPTQYPVLQANTAIGGVRVDQGAQIQLGPFNLTASADVISAPSLGGILSSSGRLILAGPARLVSGRLPRTEVTGTYTLTGNVVTTSMLRITGGRVRTSSFRYRVEP